jgi:hypothetical protein
VKRRVISIQRLEYRESEYCDLKKGKVIHRYPALQQDNKEVQELFIVGAAN